jgi:hypothetical protein
MGADIGSIWRAWFGDAMPQQEGARLLELRIGQIVRGVLLQLVGEREGIVSVGGVPVRARLEADIPVGRGVMLQVQPGSDANNIILKPVTLETGAAVPDESLKNILRSFGLPDKPWAMELLRNLKRDGFALDGETARAYAEMAAMKPPRTDARQWMTAADVAFRRGLPNTPLALASLREALFGAPVREQMQTLLNLLESALKGPTEARPEWTADAVRLQRLLIEGQTLFGAGGRWLAGEPAGSGAAAGNTAAGGPAAAANAPGTAAEAAPAPASTTGGAIAGPATASGGAAAGQAAPAVNPAQGTPAGPNTSSAFDSAYGIRAEQRSFNPEAGMRQETPGVSAGRLDAPAAPAAPAASVPTGTAPALAGRDGADWLARLFQWLGFGHEHRLAAGDATTASQAAARAGTAGAETLPPADALPLTAKDASSARVLTEAREETLKSALLALAAREDAPPAIREAAQTLAQHITGQQLLLSGERGTLSPYHFVTFFIPIVDEHGETTASVHVQTRKKRRGEWDADNVRLWFDLNMRHLGPTVVDVQVVDRIVSMKLYNDDPWFRDLAENSRDVLAAAFREAGYQLSALRAVPLPGRTDDDAEGNRSAAAPDLPPVNAADGGLATGGFLASRPYKGVDLRI